MNSLAQFLVSLAAVACGTSVSVAAADPAVPVTIVAFGDSTTARRGSLAVYSDLLREELGNVRVLNAGVGSDTTEMARARFDRDVLTHKPTVAIIQFGINDAAVDVWDDPPATQPRVGVERYAANLRCFVRELTSRRARVILLTPNPLRWTATLKELYGKPPYHPDDPDGLNGLLDSYAEAARQVARQTGAVLVDARAAFLAEGRKPGRSLDSLLLDGLHPNAEGHRVVADLLRAQLLALAGQEGLPIQPGTTHTAPRQATTAPVAGMKPAGSGLEINIQATEMPSLRMGPFVRLGEGHLLCLEGTNCWISVDEGATWKARPLFADPAKFKIDESAILRTSKGVVIAAFMNMAETHWTWDDKLGDAPGATLPTYVMRSLDEGATWEMPQKLHDDWTGANRDMQETKSGRVIFTSMKMRHNPGRHAVLTYGSDDQGQTWKPSNVIDLGDAGHHGGVTEATIEELNDGRLLMLMRSNWMRFWQAESNDGGLSWHPLGPSAIPASSAPGALQRLRSGRIVLVWNRPFPEGTDTFPLTGGDRRWSATPVSNHRGELSIAFTEDECKTWSVPVVVARKPGAWLSYPFVFEVAPGELYITTMQGGVRLKLREADFRAPSGQTTLSKSRT